MSRNGAMISAQNMLPTFVAEFVGTGLLLFLGCMGCITQAAVAPVTHHLPSAAFGFTVLTIIQIFGHISGAHVNPAVTLSSVMLGLLKPLVGLSYVVAQFAGAVFGFGALRILVPGEYVVVEPFSVVGNVTVRKFGICSTVPDVKVTIIQALGIEIIITFVLILVCCSVWDKRNSSKQDSVPLRFAIVITAIGMAAGPFTGASMNTVRSFAPALLNGDWENHWIYWVAPNSGAVLATLFYKYLYQDATDEGGELQNLNEIPRVPKNVE